MAAIRHARPEDASAIAGLWNPVIRDSVATFNRVEKTPDEVAALLAERAAAGHVWLLAEAGAPLGFATYGQFRAGVGYARTVEHTIILAPGARGRGIGRRLIEALVAEARTQGVHSLIGGISGENVGGLAFHLRTGFAEVGRLAEVGRKFDRWFDLVLVQRML